MEDNNLGNVTLERRVVRLHPTKENKFMFFIKNCNFVEVVDSEYLSTEMVRIYDRSKEKEEITDFIIKKSPAHTNAYVIGDKLDLDSGVYRKADITTQEETKQYLEEKRDGTKPSYRIEIEFRKLSSNYKKGIADALECVVFKDNAKVIIKRD